MKLLQDDCFKKKPLELRLKTVPQLERERLSTVTTKVRLQIHLFNHLLVYFIPVRQSLGYMFALDEEVLLM